MIFSIYFSHRPFYQLNLTCVYDNKRPKNKIHLNFVRDKSVLGRVSRFGRSCPLVDYEFIFVQTCLSNVIRMVDISLITKRKEKYLYRQCIRKLYYKQTVLVRSVELPTGNGFTGELHIFLFLPIFYRFCTIVFFLILDSRVECGNFRLPREPLHSVQKNYHSKIVIVVCNDQTIGFLLLLLFFPPTVTTAAAGLLFMVFARYTPN